MIDSPFMSVYSTHFYAYTKPFNCLLENVVVSSQFQTNILIDGEASIKFTSPCCSSSVNLSLLTTTWVYIHLPYSNWSNEWIVLWSKVIILKFLHVALPLLWFYIVKREFCDTFSASYWCSKPWQRTLPNKAAATANLPTWEQTFRIAEFTGRYKLLRCWIKSKLSSSEIPWCGSK